MPVLQEFRFALRALRRSPWFTLTAVLMLSIGLGLAMFMFGAIQSFALRPPPFPNGAELVHVEYADARSNEPSIEMPIQDFLALRDVQTSLVSMEGFTSGTINLSGDDRPERYNGAFVTAGAFAALGVQPLLGPGFGREDEQPGAAGKVVVSHRVWQDRYAGDPAIVGKVVRANGKEATIAGVMPPQFAFPLVNDVWLPVEASDRGVASRRDAYSMEVFGLPREGVTHAQVAQEFDALLARLNAADPQPKFADHAVVKPYQDEFLGEETRLVIGTMFVSVLLVLAIACANVANLMIARSARRTRETAIRSAVGASRMRLVASGLSEALLVCGVAAGIGFVLAQIGGEITMQAIRGSENPPPYWMTEMRIDALSVLFAAGAALMATLFAGLWPAWRAARSADSAGMREGGHGATSGRKIGRGLTTMEIALCVVLLVTAGLTVRSVIERQGIDLPIDASNALTGRVGLFESAYPDDAALVAFAGRLTTELERITGVEGAAISSSVPFSYVGGQQVQTEGMDLPTGDPLPYVNTVSAQPGYFEVLRMPLLRGRLFDGRDHAGAARVALVSQPSAQRLWGDADPIGKRFRLGSSDQPERPWVTVVGVVPHVAQDGEEVEEPSIYLPFEQAPTRFFSFAVRTAGDPYALAEPVREAVLRADPDLPVYWLRTMDEWVEIAAFDQRLLASLFGMFGLFAVLLAAGGLYAVLAYQVGQRTREIGVRRALGANDRGIVRMVVQQGVWQLVIGLAVGLLLALGFARLLANFLFGVSTHDPLTFGGVVGLLFVVAIVAAMVPTARALKVAPMQALRHD